jgi:hypothetical protein
MECHILDLESFNPLCFPSGQGKQWQPLTKSHYGCERGQILFLVPSRAPNS